MKTSNASCPLSHASHTPGKVSLYLVSFWCFPIGQDSRSKHTLPVGLMSPQAPVELGLGFYIEKDELFKQ
jgi:hypothetical protein